jgi:hypothetical protein
MVRQLLAGDLIGGSKIWSRTNTALWSMRRDRAMSVKYVRTRKRDWCNKGSREGSRLTGV